MGVLDPNSTNYVHSNEPNLLNIHKAMEYNALGQPVLRVVGIGGTMDLTALSVVTTSSYLGGSLSYNNTSGVFTFAPANELGNLSVGNDPNAVPANTNLQTILGSVNGADIVLEPLNGSVKVPALKVGSGGNILNTTLNVEAYITTYELVSIVDYSTGTTDALVIGAYGNINGVVAPWTVFQLTPGVSGTPISAITINDRLTGVGIIPSTVKDRGLGGPGGLWDNYVIINLDLAGLGQILPLPGAVFDLTRPLNKANLNIQSAEGTDIFLDSTGLGDVIVNTNILPVTNNISSLGSPTKRWKSIYLGPGTIYVFDETLGKDISIGARDGILYVQNGAGLTVGEFTFVDNQIRIANSARDIIVGATGATASVVFNRSIKVKNNLGALAFEVDRDGITSIFTPSGADPNKGTLNIIGTVSGLTQPRGTLYDGTLIHLTAQDGKSSRISSDSFGTNVYPLYVGRAARGTVSAPTASQSGDILSRFSAVGYGTNQYMTGISRFDAVAAENFTNTASGTKFVFSVTPTGSTATQISATVDSTGVIFAGAVDAAAGITFRNGDRLTYFPTPTGQTDKWLKSNGTTMSWQTLPIFSGTVIFKGSWDASTNTPALSANQVGAQSGWEYIVTVAGTRDLGNGSVTFNVGDLVIYDGATWNDIPGNQNTVTSIKFNGGSARTGAVQVDSLDITSTLNTGSIANAKLANSSITVDAGTGLLGGGTVALGSSITLSNNGVIGVSAGTGIGISGTGTITVSNTGVLSITGTNHISASVVSGAVTVTSDATTNDTNNTIALRDGSGGLIAKDYTATRDATLSTDHGPFNFGDLSYSDTGIMADFSMSVNSYNQVILQNRSAGAAASTNYIVSNNQGTASTFYGEFGMNSSGFSGSGSFALPNAVYLASVSSDLVIGTLGNNTLRIVTRNSSTDAMSVNSSGVATFANQIVGSISGSANNVRQTVTFSTTGGAAPNSTFDGANALTVDYSTVGAQAPLSSGINIKTVNNNSLVGSGNVSVGTVTSVAALTIGTAGTNITSTVANGTTTPIITLNVPTASATNRGALSSSNWTTFNNKVTSIGSITLAIGGTTTVPTVNLNSGIVTTGTTGSSTLIPVVTVDTYGRVTGITTAANPQGTVISVSGTGTVSGLTLTGTVTTSGNLTLGGTIDKASTSTFGIAKVDGTTITANAGVISATLSIDYGQFARYTDFTYASADTAYALTLDTTAISSGISRGTPTSRIAVNKSAVYKIQASVELRTTSNKGVCYLWLRKNGTDVADTNRRQYVQGQDDAINFSYSMLISLAAGDYIELYTAATNDNLYLDFSAATAFAPRTASVLVSVVQVV